VDLVVDISQTVINNRVLGNLVTETKGSGKVEGGVGHGLGTTRENNITVTDLNSLSGKGHSLKTRGADLVDGSGLSLVGEAGFLDNLSGGSLANTSLQNLAKVRSVDIRLLNVGTLNNSAGDNGTKVGAGHSLQSTLKVTNGGSGGGNNVSRVELESSRVMELSDESGRHCEDGDKSNEDDLGEEKEEERKKKKVKSWDLNSYLY
jgi:hypothetical protein